MDFYPNESQFQSFETSSLAIWPLTISSCMFVPQARTYSILSSSINRWSSFAPFHQEASIAPSVAAIAGIAQLCCSSLADKNSLMICWLFSIMAGETNVSDFFARVASFLSTLALRSSVVRERFNSLKTSSSVRVTGCPTLGLSVVRTTECPLNSGL